MSLLAERMQRLSVAQTLVMSKKARELREEGKDVISLSIGEPDFDTPDFVKEAAISAIHNNTTKYPPISGFKELKEAIVYKFQRDNGLSYSLDQIVVSTGAKQSISNVLMSILSKGDEVIILGPYWVSYFEMVKLADGTPKPLYAGIDQDFKVGAKQIEEAITENTKAVLFSSPSNPSGAVFSANELEAIASVISKHPHITIISDEIYEHINYNKEHVSIASFDEVFEQTVTVNGVSKAFAMTGWRVGYIGAPKWLASACEKVQGQVTSGASSISQMASIAALKADPSITGYMKVEFERRRDLLLDLFSSMEGFKVNIPDGAFYILPDISYFFGKTIRGHKIVDAQDFSMFLLNEANVALVSTQGFGEPNCIRLSYAASERELREAVRRIKSAIYE
ncbi:MAG: pyridoxal phosphate-dependent aminotransferase [Flavobacteriales bacterium]|nr:pyridoxal phosphate-dependent aminotransferase [Flavobacteriales bacterium]